MHMATTVAFHAVEGPNRWCIDVVADGILVGHIYRSGDAYRYFEGVCNEVIWSYADPDLARLQARIRTTIIATRAVARLRTAHAGA